MCKSLKQCCHGFLGIHIYLALRDLVHVTLLETRRALYIYTEDSAVVVCCRRAQFPKLIIS
jgi:hypothetical protein